MTEHEAYAQALTEVQRGTPINEIWLKAFAHLTGSKESQTAKYVLFRGEQLLANDRKMRANEAIKQVSAKTSEIINPLIKVAVGCAVFVAFILFTIFLASIAMAAHEASSVLGAIVAVAAIIAVVYVAAKTWQKLERFFGLNIDPDWQKKAE